MWWKIDLKHVFTSSIYAALWLTEQGINWAEAIFPTKTAADQRSVVETDQPIIFSTEVGIIAC